MKRTVLQILLLLFLASACMGGYLSLKYFLGLPFRSTNDALHEKEAPMTLDFLIPAGVHIDEKMTIEEVMKIRFKRQGTFFERALKAVAALIPARYRHVANGILFIFWTFLFMTFLRVFSFVGYGRALRTSLFLGGCIYYFVPDFSPGKMDDLFFLAFAVLIIGLHAHYHRKNKRRKGVLE